MLTNLGKELRKIRLDLGITLFEMAQKASISSAMLSSIETGKKAAPDTLIPALAKTFDLVNQQKTTLQRLADHTKKEVRLNLDNRENATELALAFARNFDRLTDDQIKRMKAMLPSNQ